MNDPRYDTLIKDVVNEAGDGSAAGQEISDVFDMDIAL